MRKKIIFELKALYRDDLRVTGYEFGHGEKSVCVVGAFRGNEVQQMYSCSQLIKRLKELEEKGAITEGKSILVIPSVNSYSMNISKRFWSTDNTDINRMFPGYNLGETTQRIAGGVFEEIKGYKYGIQFASFYMPGMFTPHVRMMKTGMEKVELASEFGLPYVVLRTPKPYDTTTLNYNWQLWHCDAFSIYTNETQTIDKKTANQAVNAVMNFLNHTGIVTYQGHKGYKAGVIMEEELVSVKTSTAGIFDRMVEVKDEVRRGDTLAEIVDPYEGTVKSRIVAPCDGIVFFTHDTPMTYNNTVVFKIIPEK